MPLPDLDGWPGTVSVWVAPVGSPVASSARLPDHPHYAASMMKVAVLAALHRSGRLDVEVPVVNDFASALPGAPRYRIGRDGDPSVWDRLGGTATLGWLGRRMIVRSSNLAANIVLEHVGVEAVREVLREAGTTDLRVVRGIEDAAAREAGIDNLITVRDLALLLSFVVRDDRMREILLAQEHGDDLAAGLPPGTAVAHKSGWVTGVRHSAGVVYPDDAPPYVIAVATTSTGRNDAAARALIAQLATATWDARLL